MRMIRLAARSSALARIQAVHVGEALRSLGGIEVEYAFRESLGDINQNDPLWKMPEKGVFTEDFRADLLSGACDAVVHSWKDLPTDLRPETEIVATLPREDQRDLLLFKRSSLEALHAGLLPDVRILSSSPRREHNLIPFLQEYLPSSRETGERSRVEFVPVRGNIPTRIRKTLEGKEDGIIVAKAALDRILGVQGSEWEDVRAAIREGLKSFVWMVLPLSMNPSAAAQGAIAIEARSDRKDLLEVFSRINCETTHTAASGEREILRSFGGGCHQKIGVSLLPKPYGTVLSLRGSPDQGPKLAEFRVVRSKEEIERVLGASVPLDSLWPSSTVEAERFPFFDRERIPARNPGGDLWVAKAEALPPDWVPEDAQIVWTGGLPTWKKLSQRGVWVSGSLESLGEGEKPRLDFLLGRAPSFTKLSHEGGFQGEMPFLATYRLLPREWSNEKTERFRAIIAQRTHFYWMSGSLFERCLSLFPEVRSKRHACGPGNTLKILSRHLDPDSIGIFTSVQEWRSEATGGNAE
jgi:hydroxymethylbilane synthase